MLTGQAHLAERMRGRWCHPIFFFSPSSALLLFRSCRIQREADGDSAQTQTHTSHDTGQACVQTPSLCGFYDVQHTRAL